MQTELNKKQRHQKQLICIDKKIPLTQFFFKKLNKTNNTFAYYNNKL